MSTTGKMRNKKKKRRVAGHVAHGDETKQVVECVENEGDAPEEISCVKSKEAALTMIEAEKSVVKQLRDNTKRRKQKNKEFLQLQNQKKRERLEKLKEQQLPSDILDKILQVEKTERKSKRQKNTSVHKSGQSFKMQRKAFAKELSKKGSIIRATGFAVAGNMQVFDNDFIPLKSKATDFRVRVLKNNDKGIVDKASHLLDLKNKLLYGKSAKRENATKAFVDVKKQNIARSGFFASPLKK